MPLRKGTPMPELAGATEWINGEARRGDLIGSPALIHFFAKSCHICHDNMPTINTWRDEYAAKGLNVVGIHMPREEQDTDMNAVRADIAQMGVTEPCAVDNQHEIGERFENQFWPAYFLFDAEGNMVGRAAGYAGLKMIEGPLKRLLENESA
jgi:thiol-disulfide isomerase/thioredoxin